MRKIVIAVALMVLVAGLFGDIVSADDSTDNYTEVSAKFTWERNTKLSIKFDASSSQGRSLEYEWDFGDGNLQTTPYPVVYHKYDCPGKYHVELKMAGVEGRSFSKTTKLVVVPAPLPQSTIRAHIDPLEGLARIIGSVLLLVAFKTFL